jgi:hypothetical protein
MAMPLTNQIHSETREDQQKVGHPAGYMQGRLFGFAPYGLENLAEQTFVSPLTNHDPDVLVPDMVRAVIRMLCHLWSCLNLCGAHEIHQWQLSSFEFLQPPQEGVPYEHVKAQVEVAQSDFTGLHACVFPDGDVSFYVSHTSAGPIFASSVMSLTQFWTPSWM